VTLIRDAALRARDYSLSSWPKKVNPKKVNYECSNWNGQMYLQIVTGIFAAIVASGSAFAQGPPPVVSPDALADVPIATPGDDLLFFYNFSWRSFIALNWPVAACPIVDGLLAI
jgi:hypothetical protein